MITIFDTNIYMEIGSQSKDVGSLMTRLKDLDKNKVCVHPIVLMELYSEFQNTQGQRDNIFSSLRAMALHGGAYCPMAPLIEVQLAKQYFGIEIEASLQTQFKLNEILIDFARYDKDIILSRYAGSLDKVNRFIQQGAAAYLDVFYALIPYFKSDYHLGEAICLTPEKKANFISFIDSDEFKIQTALAQIVAIYNYLGTNGYDISNIQIPEINQMALDYLSQYPIPIEYRKEQFREAINQEGDLQTSTLKNGIWTQHILHVLGQKSLADGEPFVFVTNDRQILAITKAFSPKICLSWDEYKNAIGLE